MHLLREGAHVNAHVAWPQVWCIDRLGGIHIRDHTTAAILPDLVVAQPSNMQAWSLVRANRHEVWAGTDNGHTLVFDAHSRYVPRR